MEGMTSIENLISRAAKAGLRITLDGSELVIEGPATCEALALQIIERKPEAARLLCDPPPTAPGRCADCSEYWEDLIAGYCYECAERRKFLANDLGCGCIGPRRWRYRDGGFYWHCFKHEQAPTRAVWSRKQESGQPAEVLKFESAMVGL